jgi:hypothetical protein
MEDSQSQVLYGVRSSEPPRPRAMPRRPVMAWGSVSRGVHRRSIELRNHLSGVLTLSNDGEGNMGECDMRVLIRLPGVRDLVHVHKLHEREPGDLGRDCCLDPKTVRSGKVEAEIPACTLPRSRTGQ